MRFAFRSKNVRRSVACERAERHDESEKLVPPIRSRMTLLFRFYSNRLAPVPSLHLFSFEEEKYILLWVLYFVVVVVGVVCGVVWLGVTVEEEHQRGITERVRSVDDKFKNTRHRIFEHNALELSWWRCTAVNPVTRRRSKWL